MRTFTSKFVLIWVIVIFSRSSAIGQTGKILALVLDSATGESLLRATVQIVETKQGAYTKADGQALIINVAPSASYRVIAKYAGYNSRELRIKVDSNHTTFLEFALSASTDTQKMVVVCKLVAICGCGCFVKAYRVVHPAPKLDPDHLRLHPVASLLMNREERVDAFSGEISLAVRSMSHYALQDDDDVSDYYELSPSASNPVPALDEKLIEPSTSKNNETPSHSMPIFDKIRLDTAGINLAANVESRPEAQSPFIVDNPYPNPATSSANWISLPIKMEDNVAVDVTMFDQLGRMLITQRLVSNHHVWQVAQFMKPSRSGIYMIYVTDGHRELIRRLSVTR